VEAAQGMVRKKVPRAVEEAVPEVARRKGQRAVEAETVLEAARRRARRVEDEIVPVPEMAARVAVAAAVTLETQRKNQGQIQSSHHQILHLNHLLFRQH